MMTHMRMSKLIMVVWMILAINFILSCQLYEEYKETKKEFKEVKNKYDQMEIELKETKAKMQSAEDFISKGENWVYAIISILSIASVFALLKRPIVNIARRLLYPHTKRKPGIFDGKGPRE